MLKRIPPRFHGVKASPQLPLQERIEQLMARLYAGAPLRPYNDPATIKACLKRGLVRRERNRLHVNWARNVLIPLAPPPPSKLEHVPQPYAKRIADLDAAGLRRRASPTAPKPR